MWCGVWCNLRMFYFYFAFSFVFFRFFFSPFLYFQFFSHPRSGLFLSIWEDVVFFLFYFFFFYKNGELGVPFQASLFFRGQPGVVG